MSIPFKKPMHTAKECIHQGWSIIHVSFLTNVVFYSITTSTHSPHTTSTHLFMLQTDVLERIRVLPPLDERAYRALLRICVAVLDPFPGDSPSLLS